MSNPNKNSSNHNKKSTNQQQSVNVELFKESVNLYRDFHVLHKGQAMKWPSASRQQAFNDLNDLFKKATFETKYRSITQAIIKECGWNTYEKDMQPFYQRDKLMSYCSRYNTSNLDQRRIRREADQNKDETTKRMERERDRDSNSKSNSLNTLIFRKKIDDIESLYDDIEDVNPADDQLQIRIPKKSCNYKQAISDHNNELYFKNSKISHHVDFVGFCLQFYIRHLGANGNTLKRHVCIAASAEHYDNKLLSSVDSLNLNYAPLGSLFILACFSHYKAHIPLNQSNQLLQAQKDVLNIYARYQLIIIPNSLHTELVSVLNDTSVNWTNMAAILEERFEALSKNPMHIINSNYLPFSVVQCHKYFIFGSCKKYDNNPSSCNKFHGCIDCNMKHCAKDCPLSPPWFAPKFNLLQRTYYNRGRGRGFFRGRNTFRARGSGRGYFNQNYANNNNNRRAYNNADNANSGAVDHG